MTWLRSDTETLYDDDLSRFVAAALRDDTVDEIVDAATNHEPIELNDRNTAAEPYVEKMLDEEVQKQFGDPKRSLVDLALNSVDARPDDAENYTVRLYNTPWSFTVADEGNGMGIETIVEQLLVPFSSEKDPTEDIGRFGVGFYSSLEHVMANPEQSTVAVNTHDGEDSYRLAFSTDGQQIDDLQLRIEEGTRKRQGTTVSVKHPNADRSEIGDYVRDYLGAMNPERVTFKGLFRQINTLPDGDRHHGTFQYDGDTHEILAVTDPESTAMDLTVTSQGVTIMDDDFSYGNVMINLPPAVGLVEGRNDFKRDAVYEKAVQTAYETLAEGIDAETYDRFVQELFPTLEDTFDIEVERAVKETVKDTMDRGTYLVPYRDGLASNMVGDRVEQFVDEQLRDAVFTQTSDTEAFWSPVYKGIDDLIDDHTDIQEVVTLYGDNDTGYRRIFEDIDVTPQTFPDVDRCVLLEHDRPGPSPFLRVDDTVYIVDEHPLYDEDSIEATHTVRASYAENTTKRMDRIDDDLVYHQ